MQICKCFYLKRKQQILLGSDLEKVSLSSRFLWRHRKEKTNRLNDSTLFAVTWHANGLPLPLKLREYCHQNQIKLKVHEHKTEDSCCATVQ